MNIEFTLNGRKVSVQAHPCDRLSDILHDKLGVKSVRSGCQVGRCGSCIVLMDSRAVPSCLVPAFRARHAEVLSFEGFVETEAYRDIERGFREAGVETCGFCLAGKVLSAHRIIEEAQSADPRSIAEGLAGTSCRCTELSSLVRGVEIAMELRRERLYGPQR